MGKIVSNYTANGSSTTDEYGTFIVLNRFLQGDVVEGFAVVANSTANMTVYVQTGSGRITTGTYPSSYGYLIAHDTTGQGEAVTIATAAASPRIDYVVAYIDKAVAGSTLGANVNNTNNVLKFASVAGTPAGSPVAPTVSQIQAAIGAANPYIILAQLAVGANVTQITNANITDKRVLMKPTIPSGVITPAMRTGGFAVGTITTTHLGTGGNKSITGLGFKPKFVRITIGFDVSASGAVRQSVGTTDGITTSVIGFATSGSSQARWSVIAGGVIINVRNEANTSVVVANFVSADTDGFTINVTSADASYSGIFEAYA